jgi:hypothetical protein
MEIDPNYLHSPGQAGLRYRFRYQCNHRCKASAQITARDNIITSQPTKTQADVKPNQVAF